MGDVTCLPRPVPCVRRDDLSLHWVGCWLSGARQVVDWRASCACSPLASSHSGARHDMETSRHVNTDGSFFLPSVWSNARNGCLNRRGRRFGSRRFGQARPSGTIIMIIMRGHGAERVCPFAKNPGRPDVIVLARRTVPRSSLVDKARVAVCSSIGDAKSSPKMFSRLPTMSSFHLNIPTENIFLQSKSRSTACSSF